MVILRTICWALLFILKLRFPPGQSLVDTDSRFYWLMPAYSIGAAVTLHMFFHTTTVLTGLTDQTDTLRKIQQTAAVIWYDISVSIWCNGLPTLYQFHIRDQQRYVCVLNRTVAVCKNRYDMAFAGIDSTDITLQAMPYLRLIHDRCCSHMMLPYTALTSSPIHSVTNMLYSGIATISWRNLILGLTVGVGYCLCWARRHKNVKQGRKYTAVLAMLCYYIALPVSLK